MLSSGFGAMGRQLQGGSSGRYLIPMTFRFPKCIMCNVCFAQRGTHPGTSNTPGQLAKLLKGFLPQTIFIIKYGHMCHIHSQNKGGFKISFNVLLKSQFRAVCVDVLVPETMSLFKRHRSRYWIKDWSKALFVGAMKKTIILFLQF